MKVLVTGAEGFIGKNLVAELEHREDVTVLPYDVHTPEKLLDEYCRECDFVFNLAGVNRPEHTEEFMEGNFGFATTLVETLRKHGNTCPVMNSSSIQAALENPYGKRRKPGRTCCMPMDRRREHRYISIVSPMSSENGADRIITVR